jgi:D-alanyl-D-alanine carboxypeptidase
MRAVFEGRVVPKKQQAEWMALVSMKTGKPIADVSADDPRGYALGLSRAIVEPLGAIWFYQGMSLGYRTLYTWFEKENSMITLQTNSQPAEDANKVHVLAQTIHQIVGSQAKRGVNGER